MAISSRRFLAAENNFQVQSPLSEGGRNSMVHEIAMNAIQSHELVLETVERQHLINILQQWEVEGENLTEQSFRRIVGKKTLENFDLKNTTLDLTCSHPINIANDIFKFLSHLTSFELNSSQLTTLNCSELTNLQRLVIKDNKIKKLLSLSSSLKYLDCSKNEIEFLPLLPERLKHLNCSANKLDSLPCLPSSLEFLDCSVNNIELLPSLPPHLKLFYCFTNNIKILPLLPEGLENLNCSKTEIEFLHSLPVSLRELICANNQKLVTIAFKGAPLRLLSFNVAKNPLLQELPMVLADCSNLTYIDYSGSPLPDVLVDTILVSNQIKRRFLGVRDLESKINVWKGYSGLNINLNSVLTLQSEEKQIVYEWLVRLERSKDFQSHQQELAQVVCNILKDLTIQEFKFLALTQMQVNNTDCEDRAAMALNELFLSWNLCCKAHDLSDEEKINLLIQASRTLALRNAIGEQLKNKKNQAESVETYLYYESSLAGQLNLLTCMRNMSYVGCALPLNLTELENYVEEHYLELAADLPVLELILKPKLPPFKSERQELGEVKKKKILDEMDQISGEYLDQIDFLEKQLPPKDDHQTLDQYEDKIMAHKIQIGAIMNQRQKAILKVKMKYLKMILDDLE